MRLRRLTWGLVVACLAAGLALPAGASERAGDGTLAVQDGNGIVQLAMRGSAIGRVDDAERVVVVDPNPADERRPVVRGWEQRRRISRRKVVFRGEEIRFRAVGGFYRILIEGAGIELSAVGRGSVTLDGDERFDNTGLYSLNGADFDPIPYAAISFRLADVGSE